MEHDEGSGTLVQDLSGKGNNGTVNGAIWGAGKYGNALSFDGTKSDYAQVNNSISLQVSGDLTLSCWVYFNTLATKQALIFKSWGGEYELSMYGTNGKLESTIQQQVFLAQALQCRAMFGYTLAVSKYYRDECYYVNGVQVGSPQAFTKLPTASSNVLYLGQENGYNPLNGTIDEIRIYNRALNENEVSALYSMGQNPDPVSFANYYNFMDSANNNTMLIDVDAPFSNNGDVTLITCTTFFSDKNLSFSS